MVLNGRERRPNLLSARWTNMGALERSGVYTTRSRVYASQEMLGPSLSHVPSLGWAARGCWSSRPPSPAARSLSRPPGRPESSEPSMCSLGRAGWLTGTYKSPLGIRSGERKGEKRCKWPKYLYFIYSGTFIQSDFSCLEDMYYNKSCCDVGGFLTVKDTYPAGHH